MKIQCRNISCFRSPEIMPVLAEAKQDLFEHGALRPVAMADEEIISLGGDPELWMDYRKSTEAYVGIETARRLLFGDDPEIKGLQVASNYGPYMHYLKNFAGMNGIFGIDNNPFAVKYAGKIGSPLIFGDALKLPVPDSSLDLVITHNFLDTNYGRLPAPFWVLQEEFFRALRPGGIHISDDEVYKWDSVCLDTAGRMFDIHRFAADIRSSVPELEEVCVFQKP